MQFCGSGSALTLSRILIQLTFQVGSGSGYRFENNFLIPQSSVAVPKLLILDPDPTWRVISDPDLDPDPNLKSFWIWIRILESNIHEIFMKFKLQNFREIFAFKVGMYI